MADEPPTPNVIGVDGARLGWVGVVWDGRTPTPLFDRTLEGLCRRAADEVGPVSVVSVDIPIELEEAERRACDLEARPLLGGRRSSLFAPPVLGALDRATYADANEWSKATTGQGISKQAWMLVPKIQEVRAFVRTSGLAVYETFPELSFRAMNGDRPLSHAKRTWTGMAMRLRLLRDAGIVLPIEAGAAGDVAADDLIDAAAAAWSARRIASGQGARVPADPADGLAAIWW